MNKFYFINSGVVPDDKPWELFFVIDGDSYDYYFYPEGWPKKDGWFVTYYNMYRPILDVLQEFMSNEGQYIQPIGYKYKILPTVYEN